MVFIIRGAGTLRLHTLNHATGRSLCGRDVPAQQVKRYLHMVSCRVCDSRLHQAELAAAELLQAIGPELFAQILAEVGIDAEG